MTTIENTKKTRHRINCVKIMLGILNTPPPTLNMRNWCADIEEPDSIDFDSPNTLELRELLYRMEDDNLCNTSCCFLGSGVVLGVGDVRHDDGNCLDWGKYSNLNFGVGCCNDWLFDPDWSNSKEQCAARMQMHLNDEIPDVAPGSHDHLAIYPELTESDITRWEKELKELEKEYVA